MIKRIDTELQNLVNSELESGEKLQWSGQPEPARVAKGTLPIFLFAIPWTAFACFWVSMASMGAFHMRQIGPMMIFPLFGLPFVFIGLGMLSTPFSVYIQAKRTVYAITNKRALMLKASGRGKTVVSYQPADFGNINRVEYAPKKGDLTWAPSGAMALGLPMNTSSLLIRSRYSGNTMTPGLSGFFGIDNPQEVESLLRQLADTKKSDPQ